jgi:hypothetical protein
LPAVVKWLTHAYLADRDCCDFTPKKADCQG